MNILVTGSAGMIGGYVVKGLIEKGHTVLGVDMRTSQWVNPHFNQVILTMLFSGFFLAIALPFTPADKESKPLPLC